MYNQANNNQRRGDSVVNFDYKEKPFFKDGKLNPKWVKEYALELAKYLGNNGLSTTQLRNFYNEFLRIKNMPDKAEEEKLILIRLIVAKVHYKKLNNKYEDFISKLIDAIGDDLNRLNDACYIMEALVAYYPNKKSKR